jgi:hypothetical protein
LMRGEPTTQITRGSDVDGAIAELQEIDVPHRGTRPPALLTELRGTLLRLIGFGWQALGMVGFELACHPKPKA